MPDKEQKQNSFVFEELKQRPLNRAKLLRRTLITAFMAVVFGLIACVTFLLLEPIISRKLNTEGPSTIVIFPEDPEEMAPEDMLAGSSQESGSSEEGSLLENGKLEELMSEMQMSRENTAQLYAAMQKYVGELQKYMVTVTALSSNVDWFNNVQESRNQRSGLILEDNGRELLILTSAQYVQNVEQIIVTLPDASQAEARLKKQDEYTNLAVIAVLLSDLTDKTKEQIAYAPLGSSNNSNMLGMPVVAMGSPLGVSNSIGYGMIAANSSTFSLPDRNYKMIQTDINGSENAAGVLFNLNGQVIGIISTQEQGKDSGNLISAIGITELRKLLEKLSNGYEIAFLGVNGMTVPQEASRYLGVPLGCFVRKVEMDSPAMRAGLQQGDIIVSVNGKATYTFTEYTNICMQLEPGSRVEMKVMRKSQDEYKEMTFQMEAQEVK